MRSLYSSFIGVVAIAIMLGMMTEKSEAQRTDDSYNPNDTIFFEIMLSDDGVIAIDTAGYEWYYDFERSQWKAGIPEPEEEEFRPSGVGIYDDEREPINERCNVEKWIKPFETKPVMVGFDEYVDGDITVLGRVTIKGWVTGNVSSLSKRVLVTETGWVDGDIEAPTIIIRDGGYVGGNIVEEASPLEFDIKSPFSVAGIIVVSSFTALLLLTSVLIITIAPRYCKNLCCCIEKNKSKTFFLGLLLWLLLAPLIVLVTVTIVGIPLTPLVPLAYVLAAFLGMIAFGNIIGGTLANKLMGGEKSRLFQTLVGILLTMSLWFVSATLLETDGATGGFGIFLLVMAILVTSFPVASGVGAAFLTRFGFREYTGLKEHNKKVTEPPPPAPPPLQQNQFAQEPPKGPLTNDET